MYLIQVRRLVPPNETKHLPREHPMNTESVFAELSIELGLSCYSLNCPWVAYEQLIQVAL